MLHTTSRGFTLLLAALVSSLVLSVGLSIVSIVQKSVTLSSIGRESQFAFYAADTGAECALYWDLRHGYFATTAPAITPTCGGQTLSADGRDVSYPYTMTFQFEPNGRCVDVAVLKQLTNPRTTIHADGYSTNCAQIFTSGRTLQRSVEIRY